MLWYWFGCLWIESRRWSQDSGCDPRSYLSFLLLFFLNFTKSPPKILNLPLSHIHMLSISITLVNFRLGIEILFALRSCSGCLWCWCRGVGGLTDQQTFNRHGTQLNSGATCWLFYWYWTPEWWSSTLYPLNLQCFVLSFINREYIMKDHTFLNKVLWTINIFGRMLLLYQLDHNVMLGDRIPSYRLWRFLYLVDNVQSWL